MFDTRSPNSAFAPPVQPIATGISPSFAALPAPPPRKRATPWDRENISETLAGIGAGFLSNQNFGEGLGAAAQSIVGRSKQLRAEERPDITYGGPGDRFEIRTDRRTGERTVQELDVFRQAAERDAALKARPDFKTSQDMKARALASIAHLPVEQRAAAYRSLLANAAGHGVDTTGMPAEWDDTYGTLGGMMGLDVNQALTQERDNQLARSLIDQRKAQQERDRAKLVEGQRHNRATEGFRDRQLRKPPASVLKPKISSANSDLSYLLK